MRAYAVNAVDGHHDADLDDGGTSASIFCVLCGETTSAEILHDSCSAVLSVSMRWSYRALLCWLLVMADGIALLSGETGDAQGRSGDPFSSLDRWRT